MILDIFAELQRPGPRSRGFEQRLFADCVEQAVLADELGFGCWWAVEHHGSPDFSYSSAPDMMLTVISQHTQRIRLGHAGVLAPLAINHPMRVAERAAFLDNVSGGRLELGLARSVPHEWETFGTDPDVTREEVRESLQMIPRMWSDGPFSWESEHIQIPEREGPHMNPGRPAGGTDQGARVRGRSGIGRCGPLPFVEGPVPPLARQGGGRRQEQHNQGDEGEPFFGKIHQLLRNSSGHGPFGRVLRRARLCISRGANLVRQPLERPQVSREVSALLNGSDSPFSRAAQLDFGDVGSSGAARAQLPPQSARGGVLARLFPTRRCTAPGEQVLLSRRKQRDGMTKLLYIALGGGLGAVLRFAVASGAQRLTAGTFPIGTLAVNTLGCLAIGLLGTLFTGPLLVREEVRFALLVGLLGGFTTFSTFGFETFALLADGEWGWALANVTLANALGLIAVWSGYRLAVLWQGV